MVFIRTIIFGNWFYIFVVVGVFWWIVSVYRMVCAVAIIKNWFGKAKRRLIMQVWS